MREETREKREGRTEEREERREKREERREKREEGRVGDDRLPKMSCDRKERFR